MGVGAVTRTSGSLACVIGDMDLVRPLALANVRSAVLAPTGSGSHFSRSARISLGWVDPWSEPDALIERLIAFGRSRPSPPVLFYEGTADTLAISRHRDALREAFRFVVADATLVEDLIDKYRFQALADRLDLPVPRTRRLDPGADPGGWRVDLPYPLLIKPVTRRFDAWGAIAPDAKAVAVDDPEGLRRLWAQLAAADLQILAQELIAGPECQIESYHTYVDEAGTVVAEFTGKKIRTRPARFGYTTSLSITDVDDVAAFGRQIVRRLGLTGVAKLDFKRTTDGQLRLLEVNPRFTLWHHPAAVAGVNIPALVWADLNGLPRPRVRRARPGVMWCDLWEDAAAAREVGELGLRWALWAARCDAKSGFAWTDPMPFVRAVAVPKVRHHVRKRVARVFASAPPAPAHKL
jgi:predicted ATP-grasp superfamily ATP-dependent carboligase